MTTAWETYKETMVSAPTLWSAAKANDLEQLGRLLDAGVERDARDHRGYSALMLAAYSGNAEAFDLLLDRGADPNSADSSGNTVLMAVAFKGHLAMVRRLLELGADRAARNAAGLDALGFATQFGRTEVITYLQTHPEQPRSRAE